MKYLLGPVIVVAILIYALRGECAYCYNQPCYDSWVCGEGCFCGKMNGEVQGVCVSR